MGYVLIAYGTAINWKANLHKVLALSMSTIKTEYIIMTKVVKEPLWLKGLAKELKVQDQINTVYCDNNHAVQLSKNQVYDERTKHIEVKLHFIREKITRGCVKVIDVSTYHNPSDIITKVLSSSSIAWI